MRILLRDAGQRVDAGAVPGAHTLVVAVSPRSAFDHGVEIDPAANASVCVVDPALGLDEAFKVVRASIEALGAKSLELGGDELSQRLAAWADAAGLRVGSLAGERADGLALDWGGQPVAGSAAARLLDAVRAARRGGCERIAVYGLGRNTHRAARALAGMPIVGFIDDDAEPGEMFLGLPVATAQRAMSMLRPDAVVLSSEAHATAMAARCAHLARAGVRIEALCEPAQALERTPC